MPGPREFAPAKVNLTLHVTGRRADGYHLLDSLVVFPRVGDLLEARPATATTLSVGGPFGAGLGGADNLVLRAASLLGGGLRHAALRLTKTLPVAGGIGGGSSDAAAALRLLTRLWGVALPGRDEVLGLGADVPVCLAGRPCRMSGIGEVLAPMAIPEFWLVLANPGVALSTGAIFSALECRDNPAMPAAPPPSDPQTFFAFVASQRNDLEPAAVAQEPAVGTAIAALAAQPGCRLARMSGSGATCFGLFTGEAPARAAASAIARTEPRWWVVCADVRDAA